MYKQSELKLIQVSITRHNITADSDANAPLAFDIDNPYSITELIPLTEAKAGKLYDDQDVIPDQIELRPECYSKDLKYAALCSVPKKVETNKLAGNGAQSPSKESPKREGTSSAKDRNSADGKLKLCSSTKCVSRERSSSERQSRRSSYSKSKSRSRSVTPQRSRPRTPSNGEHRPNKRRSQKRRSESRSPSPRRYRKRRQSRESSPQHRRRHRSPGSESPARDRPSTQEVVQHEYMMPTAAPYPDPSIMAPYLRFHYQPMSYGMPFAPAPFMQPRMMHQQWQYRPKHTLPTYMNRALPKFSNCRGAEAPAIMDATIGSTASTSSENSSSN